MQVSMLVMSVVLAINGQSGPIGTVDTAASMDPVIDHCVVALIEVAEVPGREAGVLLSLEAKEGLQVKAGTTLGHIDDTDPVVQRKIKQAEHDAAKEQAENNIDVRFAIASTDVANAELLKALDANKKVKGSIPEVEINRLRLTYEKSRLSIEKAKLDQRVAAFTADGKAAEVEGTEASIQRRRIQSPIDGIITEVYRHVGEWVSPGDPVLKVVRVDRLKVEGKLKVADYDPAEIEGRAASIEVELAHGRKVKFPGKVTFVNPQVEAGGEYRVDVEVNNREENGQWVLRPGFSATTSIHLK